MEHKDNPSTPTRELDLIRQVGEWADKMFGNARRPELGVIEEIGEASHCVLKRLQRIRGFAALEKFNEEFSDSLADATIFLCDWCNLNNAFFQFNRITKSSAENLNENMIIQHLLHTCATLFGDYSVRSNRENTDPIKSHIAQQIIQGLTYWACVYDMDLQLLVAGTWAKVSKRDWKAKPETAGND